MAQISKGDTFVNGEQVDGNRLNQLVDSAQLLVGAITEQPSITANTLEATDSTIVNDAGTLKEATIGDILNSNLPITTSSINGVAGADMVVTPAAGQKLDINGAFEANSNNTVGNSTVGGNLTVTGSSTLTGNVVADNAFTSNGIANFTGQLQVNGTVGYILTEIVEETISVYSTASLPATWTTTWTSSSHAKPVGEMWIVEAIYNYNKNVATYAGIRLRQTSSATTLTGAWDIEGAASIYQHHEQHVLRWVFQPAASFTSTFTIDAIASTAGYGFTLGDTAFNFAGYFPSETIGPSMFRIYKYKTA